MLLSVGAKGYDKATVQEVLERSGISRDRFQRRFGGKEACFAQAYEMAADRVCAEVLEAGREAESWRAGFRAALAKLLRTVAEQPLLARALTDRGAGGPRARPGPSTSSWSSASPAPSTPPAQIPAPGPPSPSSPPSSSSARSRKRSPPRSAPAAPPRSSASCPAWPTSPCSTTSARTRPGWNSARPAWSRSSRRPPAEECYITVV